jgi:hypothetical protein
MYYATMNDVVRFLRGAHRAHAEEYDRLYAEKQRHLDEMRKIDFLIHQIESQYPKPDEEEK